ncbi:MAG: hypothetical protein GYB34_07990 [Gammaproteobacteria bacterium]|nr:hypothetical protein [Rickettsiales bacterium]MBR9784280.1 hypothetical protein [Gammaproteobacteria bacterium]
MAKVSFFDIRVVKKFLEVVSVISFLASLSFIFIEIPKGYKLVVGGIFLVALIIFYIWLWWRSNNLECIHAKIEGSDVIIKKGDIFKQDGFKAIAFNEYFDTQVDEKIISSASLNGKYITDYLEKSVPELDKHIESYCFDDDDIIGENSDRKSGKKLRFEIGAICILDEYLLTAFSKFDDKNRASLTMPEYLSFLINFWDRVNRVYAQKSVSVPIFGSGITRIKEHKNISDEDLLKIMLWTFRISEMKFNYPAKLAIIIHPEKVKTINLLDIKSANNGL